jgi:hypothetical protein
MTRWRHLAALGSLERKFPPRALFPVSEDGWDAGAFAAAVAGLSHGDLLLRSAHLTALIELLSRFPASVLPQLAPEHMVFSLELFADPVGYRIAILFLAWVSFFTSDFSQFLLCETLVAFFTENLEHFEPDPFAHSLVLLSNLLADTRDASLLERKGLCQMLLSFPIERWTPEFWRLTSRLLSCEQIHPDTLGAFLDLHLQCLLTEETPLALKRPALSGLQKCCANGLNSIVERRLLLLIPHLRCLLTHRDAQMLARTLEICCVLFAESAACADCLIDTDLAGLLRELIGLNDDGLKRLALEAARWYATANAAFGDDDAAAFVTVDFTGIFQEGSFAVKVAAIGLCQALVPRLSDEMVPEVLRPPLLETFAEILEAGEAVGKTAFYSLCDALLRALPGLYGDVVREVISEHLAEDLDSKSPEVAQCAQVVNARLEDCNHSYQSQ